MTFASHFLFPSVRWFFRRRMERAVSQLNKRLTKPIEPFRIMRHQDQVTRLIYDPRVMEAVRDYARDQGVPPNVAFELARSYAKEIVPGFSTTTYFVIATRMAQKLSQMLYDVRLGGGDLQALAQIDRDASVVFVMNHRSNMDYVLITWLASKHSALSYAVGEWARVWPLQALIRATGAFFIRRRYANTLYRAVLARYVQMAVREGTTQAIFPEGGLSLDGRVGAARVGLLDYILRGASSPGGPDVIFIPVALNYDRVLEDRVLISAGQKGVRRFDIQMKVVTGFVLRVLWQKLTGRFVRFGHAAVCYGAPLSLQDLRAQHPDLSADMLSAMLMTRIQAAIPVLPVPLVAAALVRAGGKMPRDVLVPAIEGLVASLQAQSAWLHLPQGASAQAATEGLAALLLRGLVESRNDTLFIAPEEEQAVSFYASSILQRLSAPQGLAPSGTLELGPPSAGT
ncbi:MAG: 1-acyl-sn-glycerol-3-phosphate acyltransferase [Roseinatronobacter sp.]